MRASDQFAVVEWWNADDYFGHYQSTKYLPDFDFTDIVLDFDYTSTNLQWIESLKFPSIDWPYLDYALTDNTSGSINLQPFITSRTGRVNAQQIFTVNASGSSAIFDRVTLTFERFAWDYIVPGNQSVVFSYFNSFGTGFHHTVTINGTTYTYIQLAGDSSTAVATGVKAAAAGDPNVSIAQAANVLTFTPITNQADAINMSASDGNGPGVLWRAANPSNAIAAWFAATINATSWDTGTPVVMTATASTNTFTVTANGSNYGAAADGNMAVVWEQHKNSTTTISPNGRTAFGGAADSTSVHFTIPFNSLVDVRTTGAVDKTKIRQLWMTFAPALTNGTAYAAQQFSATATNWTVTDPSSHRGLKIAGSGSVRMGSRDYFTGTLGVKYVGASWAEEASNEPGGTGWFHHGFARRGLTTSDSVTIKYSNNATHDLYLGTHLYTDRGIVSLSLDGGAATTLDCYIAATAPITTRRKIGSGIAAGSHTLTITLSGTKNAASSNYYFYFDYLEAAIASDVPDPANVYANVMAATDWDTMPLQLSPQRTVWMLDRMGFAGQMDHYVGAIYWNERKRVLAIGQNAFHAVTITFAGWAGLVEDLQQIKLQFGGAAQGDVTGTYLVHQYLPTDTNSSIAAFMADYVNELLPGVEASATGAVLTITSRAPSYSFTFWAFATSTDGAATFGTETVTGDLNGGDEGTWVVDDTISPVINKAATDWHADFWAEVAAKGWPSPVASFSMELVNPPDAIGHVFAQRFLDGPPVVTSTGFGGLFTTQCTFNSTHRAYQQQAFKEMAGMMNAAGLTPFLQFGEFLWWFFTDWSLTNTGGGMAFYDADTTAAASTALGRSLVSFILPTDDPSVNSFADANFLRGLIYTHCAAIETFVKATYATAKFEVLWPYDVNYPVPVPISGVGGRLNRYVNLPSQWMTKSGSGLDQFKMEALAFGATERDFSKALETIRFPYTATGMSWTKADTRYLVPVFNGGCPYQMEYNFLIAEGLPAWCEWALDHRPLMSLPMPLPTPAPTSRVL